MSFKVTDFGTNRKAICDFLLVINTNFSCMLAGTIYKSLQIIGYICAFDRGYLSFNTLVRGESLNSRPHKLASGNSLYIVRCWHIDRRLFRFVTVHAFDRQYFDSKTALRIACSRRVITVPWKPKSAHYLNFWPPRSCCVHRRSTPVVSAGCAGKTVKSLENACHASVPWRDTAIYVLSGCLSVLFSAS